MSTVSIKLGSTVECAASGVRGYAVAVSEMFNGNLRYSVQPHSEDGDKMLDAWDIDQQILIVVDDGISERATTPPSHELQVGMQVRDVLSGFEGSISTITTHINGCVMCVVIPKVKEASLLNEAPSGSFLPVERLEQIGNGARPIVEKVRKTPNTGGPSTRSLRM